MKAFLRSLRRNMTVLTLLSLIQAHPALSVGESITPDPVPAIDESYLLDDLTRPLRAGLIVSGDASEAFWELVAKQDLYPKYFIAYSNALYWFSDLFKVERDRPTVLGIIRVNGKDYLRLFYLSHSQSTWRVLPSINQGMPYLPFFDKGESEHSLNLPNEIQAYLAGYFSKPVKELSEQEMNLLERGTVQVFSDIKTRCDFMKSPNYIGHHIHFEYILRGKTTLEERSVPSLLRNSPPHLVAIADEGDTPDFSKTIRTYFIPSMLSEKFEALVYASKNDRLEFTLIRDPENRIFFSNIALRDPSITIYGVPSRAIIATDLTLPLWEYKAEAPWGFREGPHPEYLHYHCIWPYLRMIPDIIRWYSAHQLPVPESAPHA